jgi:hypothetical protein
MRFELSKIEGGIKVKASRKHALAIILILEFSVMIAQPLMLPAQAQSKNLTVDETYWLHLAKNAWNYFQPGAGVDPTTGLHESGIDYPYFTDWDLGVYIETVIDANKLGILSTLAPGVPMQGLTKY